MARKRRGATWAFCRNASNEVATCSSSIRYKENVVSFAPGLDLIKRLRPVAFTWKAGGQRDFGLVAEEVAAVEPLLTTTNERGETEGVKYDRVAVVAVTAIQEQQKQIDEQRKIIERQQSEIDALKNYICAQNPAAGFCTPPEKK
ncbi:MAG: tail fiber domain-containing protein [Candidatus Promineofilum sp.]|nr:tail fiber domain-containing protein [Promineifilum sp.]